MNILFRVILSILLLPILILVQLYVIVKFNRDKKEKFVFENNEIDEEKLLMEEVREKNRQEEWWDKHYILRFFYNLPPRSVITNR